MPVSNYTMDFIDVMIKKIVEKIPFTYLYSNYEYKDAKDISEIQNIIRYCADNYYVGLVCKKCYPNLYSEQKKQIRNTSRSLLNCVWLNSNISKTFDILKYILTSNCYDVVFITKNDNHIITQKIYSFFGVAYDNSNNDYNYNNYNNNKKFKINIYIDENAYTIKHMYANYMNNPTETNIALYDIFDPILKSKCSLYQNGSLPPCNICNIFNVCNICDTDVKNNNDLIETSYTTNLIEKCVIYEYYPFGDWNEYNRIYNNNVIQIMRAYRGHINNENANITYSEQDFYSRWMYSRCLRIIGSPLTEQNYLETYKKYPERVEPLYEYLSTQKNISNVNKFKFLAMLEGKPIPKYGIYINEELYKWKILLDMFVLSFEMQLYSNCKMCLIKLDKLGTCPYEAKNIIKQLLS